MPMTQDDLIAARTAWGDELLAIAKAFEDGGIDAARAVANGVLDEAYGYDLGPVLFKPTLSGGPQTFRTTKAGALSYFVAHDDTYPDDTGFAIRPWRDVQYKEAASFIEGDVGMWMGSAFFTDKDGNVTQADKTFGYKKDADGNVKVVLHHSSLPYAA
ncbi:hypothetical protein SAMN05444287_2243 [Octadecabacter temperatus]|uniref:Uncharacterized protein n=1 Tax=Octadecabacter temperatus TaxID=1458307 RepID=A0A0K0Y1R0_9RHOB|nr:phosphoribosyl-AMP cyclohydrolase [Octadecabacter temperatus]AKS44842.1 hypothetical protein OSB_02740 [Octadecabacter temperatus]SIO34641.1 hypothetical protein SAMN05444287_2243 [Octadecabacter temperatus]